MLVPGSKAIKGAVGCDHERALLGRLVASKDVVHDHRASRAREEIAFQTDHAARGNVVFQVGFPRAVLALHQLHVPELPAASPHLLDDRALIVGRHMDRQLLVRFADDAVVFMEDHFGPGHLQLVALAAHRLDQHRQLQLAAAGDQQAVGAVRILHAQRDVRLELAIEPLAQMA